MKRPVHLVPRTHCRRDGLATGYTLPSAVGAECYSATIARSLCRTITSAFSLFHRRDACVTKPSALSPQPSAYLVA
ncbi:MAG: hypothetical protein ACK4TF_08105, partial [Thermodesulfovibrionales bacterium]